VDLYASRLTVAKVPETPPTLVPETNYHVTCIDHDVQPFNSPLSIYTIILLDSACKMPYKAGKGFKERDKVL